MPSEQHQQNSIQPISHSTLPTKRGGSSVQQALADRLLLSDAIDAVGKMIRGYANSGQAGKSYIGAIADLLMRYPRSVALGCADPFNGVARDTRFLPTPADVIRWCEAAVAPMYEQADYERRAVEQLQERENWSGRVTPPSLKVMGQRWLDRTDPVAKALAQAAIGESEAEAQRKRDQALDANRRLFLKECEREGIDPARGVSPSLLKLLGEQSA